MRSLHQFEALGFGISQTILSASKLSEITQALENVAPKGAGIRQLLAQSWCQQLAAQLQTHPSLAAHIPAEYCAVQCTYFEKSTDQNWLVPIHQDLSIPVKAKIDTPDWQGWSEKEGQLFVQAPRAVLEHLIAVRLHIDACDINDGALRVVPRSHLFGRLSNAEGIQLREQEGEQLCPVEAGAVMLMRPQLLHASSKASRDSRRRVLHFVFAPADLPDGLEWC